MTATRVAATAAEMAMVDMVDSGRRSTGMRRIFIRLWRCAFICCREYGHGSMHVLCRDELHEDGDLPALRIEMVTYGPSGRILVMSA